MGKTKGLYKEEFLKGFLVKIASLSDCRVRELFRNVQATSADLLARAVIWAGETPSARNELFNVTNGDTFRCQHRWPRIAKMLGMEIADPVPFSLTTYMADKESVWHAIVKREKLSHTSRWSPGASAILSSARGSTMFRARSRFARRASKNASTARRCSPGYSSAFEK